MIFEVITTVTINIYIFWDVTPCSLLESCRCFGRRVWLWQWIHQRFCGLETEYFNNNKMLCQTKLLSHLLYFFANILKLIFRFKNTQPLTLNVRSETHSCLQMRCPVLCDFDETWNVLTKCRRIPPCVRSPFISYGNITCRRKNRQT